jgi:type 1 glutamine amidotransferase
MANSLLYVTQVAPYLGGPAGVHGVLPQSATAIGELAESAGLSFRTVTDVRSIGAEEIGQARVVALFTIGETPWSEAQRRALVEGLRSGSSCVLAIHAATDSCHGWEEYLALVGARFDGHPWTQQVSLEVCDPTHPAVAHLGASWKWHDEIYQFRDLRPDARILLRVNEAELDLNQEGAKRRPFGFPMCWSFSEGAGRVFSTSLGHFPAAWENPTYLRHLAGGLEWALGR